MSAGCHQMSAGCHPDVSVRQRKNRVNTGLFIEGAEFEGADVFNCGGETRNGTVTDLLIS